MSELTEIVAAAAEAESERWRIGNIELLDAQRFAAASHDDVSLAALQSGSALAPPLYLSSVLDWEVGTPSALMRPDGLSEREAPFVGLRQVRLVHGGQRLEWDRPVRVGEDGLSAVRRVTRANLRTGRSGELAVLDFQTDVVDDRDERVMSWAETILALPPVSDGDSPSVPVPFQPPSAPDVEVTFTPVDLLRFSAVTANTHRIHVDSAFAAAEGFTGPVVQSSLHGVSVLRAARAASGDERPPRTLAWRNLAPAVAGDRIGASARPAPTGAWEADEWIVGGAHTASGSVTFDDA